MIDDFLHDKKEVGSHDSEGSFTLDKRAASEKLGLYLLPGPSFRILKFIQAAVAAQCESVDLKISSRKLSLVARQWQADFSFEELIENSLAHLTEQPTTITVRWKKRRAVLEGQGTRVETVSGPPTADVSVNIDLKRPLFKIQELRKSISERCWASPIPIRLDGRRLDLDNFPDSGYRPVWNSYLPATTLLAQAELPQAQGRVALSIGLRRSGLVYFVQSGVIIERRDRLFSVPGVVALIWAEHLRTDLSEFRLAEDLAYQEILSQVERTAQRLRKEVLERLDNIEAQFAPFALSGKIRWKKRVSGTALGIVGGATALLGLTGDIVLGTFLIGSPLLVCATVASASLANPQVFEPTEACHKDLREQIRTRLSLDDS